MNLLKKVTGNILSAISMLTSKVLDVLIGMIETIVTLVNDIKKLFWGLIGAGGCLLLFFFGPLVLALLRNPITLLTIIFLIIFPILGTKFVSYLKYLKYIVTEYLFDHANYLIHEKNKQFESFSEYGAKYKKAEEARRRKEQQQRQSQQQKEWEDKFRMWHEYQNSQRRSSGQSNDGWHGQYSNYGSQHPYADPTAEFKKKFEESCDLLGIAYNADKYQKKLAYRKKAKEYHPDVNKSSYATNLFKQINNAYEFLSDEHLERYKRMK